MHMKNVMINFSVMLALLTSCSPVPEQNTDKGVVADAQADTVSRSLSEKSLRAKIKLSNDLSALIPIDLLDSISTNVYEKYGIEFSGNCYACDLARLSMTANKMIWTNVCDEKDTFKIDAFSATIEENKTIFKTAERTYILTKIDPAPVYELVIDGQKLALKNKRIARYFTTKEALPLFKEHDCGDFDG
jgi:hypothetical protein